MYSVSLFHTESIFSEILSNLCFVFLPCIACISSLSYLWNGIFCIGCKASSFGPSVRSIKKNTASVLASLMYCRHDSSNTLDYMPTRHANGAAMKLGKLGGKNGTTLNVHSKGLNKQIKPCIIRVLSLMSSMIRNMGRSYNIALKICKSSNGLNLLSNGSKLCVGTENIVLHSYSFLYEISGLSVLESSTLILLGVGSNNKNLTNSVT